MARAKRTDRTEARRRHRSEQTVTNGTAAVATAGEFKASTPAKRQTQAAQGERPERPSVTAAFRAAFRPVDLSGDLRALPRLLIHWSFWGPALATIAASAVFIVWSQGWQADVPASTLGTIAVLALQMFVYPVPAPAGTAFIAGFGAPRASWLIGILLGVLAAAAYAAVLYLTPTAVLLDMRMVSSADNIQATALSAFLIAPIGSALFAAAAAWYRRFLNLANPNRQQQRRGQPVKATQGRGDIKRDRLSH